MSLYLTAMTKGREYVKMPRGKHVLHLLTCDLHLRSSVQRVLCRPSFSFRHEYNTVRISL